MSSANTKGQTYQICGERTAEFDANMYFYRKHITLSDNKTLDEFLNGKSPLTVGLFNHLVDEFNSIGAVTIHPLKSMIAIAGQRKFAYIIQLGKNFIDVVLPFKQPYTDNLCFNKIKQVPGTNDYNHHLRLFFPEDINEEVRHYMHLAYNAAG